LTVSLFFLTFTQFFPAVTGIDAGVGMSGDLRDPKKSLVNGTFLAIAVTFTVYIIAAIIFSMIKSNHLVTGYLGGAPTGNLLTDLLGLEKAFPDNFFGLMILAGILFATSSSALSCFMTAPRTLQSLARDNVLPGRLSFLAKDFRRGGNEPRFATLVSFFFGISVIWLGNINLAAMIVGICFLIVYGWVNGSAFLERISGNPTFRPTSKGHWLISLYGFSASVTAILLFSWMTGVVIVITQFIIFRLILKYKAYGRLEGVWWGVLFAFITRGIRSLKKIVQGTKNWRPILAVFSFAGKENCPGVIMNLADMIAAYKGVVTSMVLVKDRMEFPENETCRIERAVSFIDYDDPTESLVSIVQAPLMGDIPVNTVLLEYSRKIDSVKVINKVLSLEMNILILKNGDRLKSYGSIDIWWRGEKNGNLMVLLAYIIRTTLLHDQNSSCTIRIIRMLQEGEGYEEASGELNRLLSRARLSGEVLVIPFADAPFQEVLASISSGSDLIMMGIPGNTIEKDTGLFFKLNEFFFDKEIEKYREMPPVLFVKSAYTMDLIED
jgi:hypothetical protein